MERATFFLLAYGSGGPGSAKPQDCGKRKHARRSHRPSAPPTKTTGPVPQLWCRLLARFLLKGPFHPPCACVDRHDISPYFFLFVVIVCSVLHATDSPHTHI
ncbi:hypothetical protein TW95_gp1431 [Pandoravirus inopinatum]|uniref:Uncharacterized protein n=1 Tax=Pandoravirus inopinatum TaxID=1605721 RepID=A0A0B5J8E7_9VIRU|nr:hypothetical protein TW95_gp1431 [Pandoravirus inopinatum]AJF98165.1 hypothetical protein [Pandoravirus inopinatum]